MNAITIKTLIESQLPRSEARVQGDGTHFTTQIICSLFTGQSRLQRERLVLDTVKPLLLSGALHALSIVPFTQEEWEQQAKD